MLVAVIIMMCVLSFTVGYTVNNKMLLEKERQLNRVLDKNASLHDKRKDDLARIEAKDKALETITNGLALYSDRQKDDKYYLYELYDAENYIATRLSNLNNLEKRKLELENIISFLQIAKNDTSFGDLRWELEEMITKYENELEEIDERLQNEIYNEQAELARCFERSVI